MLDIILNILLVLLIIIGVLLGILLLALGVVLFVPIRYSSEGSYNEKFRCTFSVTWLLKIFQFVGGYNDEDGLTWKIKLFYRDYVSEKEPTEVAVKEEASKEPPAEKPEEKVLTEAKPEEKVSSERSEKPPAKAKALEEKPKKKTIKEKWAELKAKIKDLKTKATDIWGKVKNILLKVDDFVQFAKQEKVKKEFRTIGRLLLKVLNHIKPKLLKGRLLIGMGEPDKTGMVIGIMCILYGIYGDDFTVTADFENKIIEGEYLVKGRFNLFLFVWVFIRILCQKNLMVYIFNLIKNEFLSKK